VRLVAEPPRPECSSCSIPIPPALPTARATPTPPNKGHAQPRRRRGVWTPPGYPACFRHRGRAALTASLLPENFFREPVRRQVARRHSRARGRLCQWLADATAVATTHLAPIVPRQPAVARSATQLFVSHQSVGIQAGAPPPDITDRPGDNRTADLPRRTAPYYSTTRRASSIVNDRRGDAADQDSEDRGSGRQSGGAITGFTSKTLVAAGAPAWIAYELFVLRRERAGVRRLRTPTQVIIGDDRMASSKRAGGGNAS